MRVLLKQHDRSGGEVYCDVFVPFPLIRIHLILSPSLLGAIENQFASIRPWSGDDEFAFTEV